MPRPRMQRPAPPPLMVQFLAQPLDHLMMLWLRPLLLLMTQPLPVLRR